MAFQYRALTIDQLLNDPMTLAVMQADHVDPAALKAMLVRTAARLRAADQDTPLPGIDAAFLPADPVPDLRKAV